ncbi:MAG: hypothetical protein ACHREM_23370 [Polyangiales bacterium]
MTGGDATVQDTFADVTTDTTTDATSIDTSVAQDSGARVDADANADTVADAVDATRPTDAVADLGWTPSGFCNGSGGTCDPTTQICCYAPGDEKTCVGADAACPSNWVTRLPCESHHDCVLRGTAGAALCCVVDHYDGGLFPSRTECQVGPACSDWELCDPNEPNGCPATDTCSQYPLGDPTPPDFNGKETNFWYCQAPP